MLFVLSTLVTSWLLLQHLEIIVQGVGMAIVSDNSLLGVLIDFNSLILSRSPISVVLKMMGVFGVVG